MISYPVYKLIHFLGIFLIFVALTAALARAAWAPAGDTGPWKGPLRGLHGTGLLLAFLGGFGLMSRLGIPHTELYPGWIWAKVLLWLLLGGLIVIPSRKPEWAAPVLASLPLVGLAAAALAVYKPFG